MSRSRSLSCLTALADGTKVFIQFRVNAQHATLEDYHQAIAIQCSAMVVVEQEKKKMEGDDSLTALLTSFSLHPAFFLLLSGLVSNPKGRKKKKGRIRKKRFRLRVERLQTSIPCIMGSQSGSSLLF